MRSGKIIIRKIVMIFFLFFLTSSCGEIGERSHKLYAFPKCDSRYGVQIEQTSFSLSSKQYIESSRYLQKIYELRKLDINKEKICGYKVLKSQACYYFIDISYNAAGGNEICVNPKTYIITYYKFEN